MQEPTPLGRAEQELEEALGGLAPAPAGISSEEVWYRAGLAAGRRRTNAWRAVAVCIAGAAGISILWGPKPVPLPADRIVVMHQTPTPPAPATITDRDTGLVVISTPYLRLRDELVEKEAGSLPAVAAGEGRDLNVQRAWPPRALDAAAIPQSDHSTNIRGG